MSNYESFFPTGIVTGNAFCDREEERAYLKSRLQQNAHVVLMSPRRYGKSSLVSQFTHEQQIPFCAVDFLPATSSKYIKNAIVDGATQLLDRIMPASKKAQQKLMSYFVKMNPSIELSAFGQKIKLNPEERTPEETIMKLLLNLNDAAKEMNQKIIFVMDEFQQIANLDNSHALEASIRHAVERSRHVFYIFSGSNRTLLEEMFSNSDRPLYHLCDEVKLNRISALHYQKFIQHAAKKTWGKKLDDETIEAILSCAECHPYYVNRLCRMLWDNALLPSTNDVYTIWKQYTKIQKNDWASDMISQLSVNQRILLAALAKQPEALITSAAFISRTEIAASSIQRTVDTLEKRDIICQDKQGYYKVLNPVIRTVLADNKYF